VVTLESGRSDQFDRNLKDPTNELTVRQKKKQIVNKENRVVY